MAEQHMMKQGKLVPIEDLNKEQVKVDRLQEEVDEYKRHVEQLKSQAEKGVMVQSAYNSDKQASAVQMETFKQDNDFLKEKLRELEMEMKQIVKERDQHSSDVAFYKARNQQLESNMARNQNVIEKLHSDKGGEEDDRQSLRDRVSDLESDLHKT